MNGFMTGTDVFLMLCKLRVGRVLLRKMRSCGQGGNERPNLASKGQAAASRCCGTNRARMAQIHPPNHLR